MRPNNICCLGGNHTGGVISCVIAFKCPEVRVTVVDNEKVISEWNSDNLPYDEPELMQLIKKCRNRNLFFSSDHASSVRDADLIFLPYSVPIRTKGTGGKKIIDFKELEDATKMVAAYSESDKIVVEKSDLPARAVEKVSAILEANSQRAVQYQVLSNPHFMNKGTAVKDFMNADSIIIGCLKNPTNKAAAQSLTELYECWIPRKKIIMLQNWSAEVIQFARNAFIAQSIASFNTLSMICEELGGDATEVGKLLAADPRLEMRYFNPSLGFGGFQEDITNLLLTCETLKLPEVANYWKVILDTNRLQTKRFIQKIKTILHPLADKQVSIWGISYEKNRADATNSPSIEVCETLLSEGCGLRIYDPALPADDIEKALDLDFRKERKAQIKIFDDISMSTIDSSAIIICTNWDEFQTLDYTKLTVWMKSPTVIDGHRFLNEDSLRAVGIKYYSLGSKATDMETFETDEFLN